MSDDAFVMEQVWVVDAVVGEVVSVEVDGMERIDVPASIFPVDLAEGMVYRVRIEDASDPSTWVIVADDTERDRRLERSREQVDTPSPTDGGGDIVL